MMTLTAAVWLLPRPASASSMALSGAIESALANNPSPRLFSVSLQSAETGISQTEADFLPTISTVPSGQTRPVRAVLLVDNGPVSAVAAGREVNERSLVATGQGASGDRPQTGAAAGSLRGSSPPGADKRGR